MAKSKSKSSTPKKPVRVDKDAGLIKPKKEMTDDEKFNELVKQAQKRTEEFNKKNKTDWKVGVNGQKIDPKTGKGIPNTSYMKEDKTSEKPADKKEKSTTLKKTAAQTPKKKSSITMGKPLRIDEDAGLAKPKKKASDYDKMAGREQDTINKGKSSVIKTIDQEGMVKAKKKKVRF